jgi:hypothetical protein
MSVLGFGVVGFESGATMSVPYTILDNANSAKPAGRFFSLIRPPLALPLPLNWDKP